MRFAIFVIAMLFALPAFADGPTGVTETSVKASDFHLITFKCEPDDDDGAQTTPQSPPLDVDDPGTPGCNSWEINIMADGDLTAAQSVWERPLLDLNYGIGDNIELTYTVPLVEQQANSASISAVGESAAAIKWMFYDNEETGTQMAIYPQVTLPVAETDAVSKGLVTPGSITTVPLLFTTQLGRTPGGPVDLTADLGYNFSSKSDTTDFLSASLGVGAPLVKKIGIMGELVTQQAFSTDDTGTRQELLKADLGFMGTVSKKFLLFGAVGHSLIASDQLDHAYLVAGFQLLAGSPGESGGGI